MHSTAIILSVFASLALHAYGYMLMRTQTYDFNATDTDNKGKTIPVSGAIIDLLVIYVAPKSHLPSNEARFKISANLPGKESIFVPSPYSSDLDSVETLSDQESDKLTSLSGGASVIGVPSQTFQTPTPFEQKSSTVPKVKPSHHDASSQSRPTTQAKVAKVTATSASPPAISNQANNASSPSALPNQANNASSPSALPNQANNAPSTTTFPNQANNAPPPMDFVRAGNLGPVLGGETSAPQQAAGMGNMRMKRSILDSSSEKSDNDEAPKTYKVQNVKILPSDRTASIKLAPIRGKPWINKTGTGDDKTSQLFENAQYLNMEAPISNVDVSPSSSDINDDDEGVTLEDVPTANTKHYQSLDTFLLALQNNATNDVGPIIESSLNRSASNQQSLTSDFDGFEKIISDEFAKLDKVGSMLDNITDISNKLGNASVLIGNSTDLFGNPTGETVEIYATGLPANISNTRYNWTVDNQPSRPVNDSGTMGNMTMEHASVGAGDAMIPSKMVIFASLIMFLSCHAL